MKGFTSPQIYQSSIIGKTVDFDEASRSATSVITKEVVDSDGEVVRTEGLDWSRFAKNPIVLFMHDPYYPVGSSSWQKPRRKSGSKEIIAQTRFAETEDAEEIFQLTIQGILKGTSIGMWWPSIVRRDLRPDDLADNPQWAGARQVVESARIMEYSHVTIPACEDALTLASSKGIAIKRAIPYLKNLPKPNPVIKVISDQRVEERPKPLIRRLEPSIKVVREPMLRKHIRQIVAISQGRL